MAINTAIIQHRRGSLDDFNPEKLTSGELAVITDERSVYMGFPGGEAEKIVLEKDFTSESIKEKLGYEPADEERVNQLLQKKADYQYVDEKVSNVKVDLTGYAKEDYVDDEIEELNKKIVQETGKLSEENAELKSDLDDYNARLYNTKLITKQLSDFDFYADGRISESGDIIQGNSNKVVTFKKEGIKKIYANYAEFPVIPINVITIKDNNENVVYFSYINTSSKEYTFDISNLDDDCIVYFNYFNYNSDTYTHELTFEYTIPNAISNEIDKIKTGYDISNIPFNDVYGKTATFKFDDIKVLNGYTSVGSYLPTGKSHKHVIFESKTVKSITVNTNTEAVIPFAFLYDTNKENGSTIISTSGGTYTFTKPTDGYIGVNHFLSGDYNHEFTIEFFDEKTVKGYITELPKLTELKYKHIVRKPLTFTGKTCEFAGDSITYGFTSGSTTVHNTGDYPTLFCNKVGATKINRAVGGALFCSGYNTVKTIPEQISEANKECDFLFIAGGINDWQSGQTLSDLETVLDNLCTYINETFSQSTQVIWITPINQAGWETTHTISPTATVQEFRNLITRTVLKNDIYSRFSIVQGNEFNFPDKNDDSSYIAAMFGDLLHPSELGYRTLYLTGLLNALY